MKRRGALQTLVAVMSIVVGAVAGAELAGSEAPDFALKSVSGENRRLSEYRGRVVLLSFWASWCGDCRSQLTGLADLHGRYAGAGLELMAVSLDTTRAQAADAAESLRMAYPVLHDAGGEVGRAYAVDSMPFVVLIDRDGVVRDVFEGYRRGDEEQYVVRIRELLSE